MAVWDELSAALRMKTKGKVRGEALYPRGYGRFISGSNGCWNYNDNRTIPGSLRRALFDLLLFALLLHLRIDPCCEEEHTRTHTRERVCHGNCVSAWRSTNGLITRFDIFLDIAKSEWNRAGVASEYISITRYRSIYLIGVFIVNNKRLISRQIGHATR